MNNIIEDRIKNVMSAVFEIPEGIIQDDSSPDTIESWDSLKHMNLIIALEEEFDYKFSDSETIELLNFKLISTILSEHSIN
tara:strand:- start:62 stop:304 length:243 start_codon:yes stop_codon:yes gene_type:complete